jgi:hypothetical protein
MGESYKMEKDKTIHIQATRRVINENHGQKKGDAARSGPTEKVNRKSVK